MKSNTSKSFTQDEKEAIEYLKRYRKEQRKPFTKNETILVNELSKLVGSLTDRTLNSIERKNILKEVKNLIEDFLENE